MKKLLLLVLVCFTGIVGRSQTGGDLIIGKPVTSKVPYTLTLQFEVPVSITIADANDASCIYNESTSERTKFTLLFYITGSFQIKVDSPPIGYLPHVVLWFVEPYMFGIVDSEFIPLKQAYDDFAFAPLPIPIHPFETPVQLATLPCKEAIPSKIYKLS